MLKNNELQREKKRLRSSGGAAAMTEFNGGRERGATTPLLRIACAWCIANHCIISLIVVAIRCSVYHSSVY